VALVLVVEDDESFSDALSYMLRKEGFEVAVCPTGPDAQIVCSCMTSHRRSRPRVQPAWPLPAGAGGR
jgi:ActR/RegA family two-component response regulator